MARFVKRRERLEALKSAGAYTVQFSYDPDDIRDMRKLVQSYPVKMRKKVIRRALVRWCSRVEARARANAHPNANRTKANLFHKVRVYKRAVWGAVGVRTGMVQPGQELKGRYGDMLPGWRSHLYEVGWRPYPKLWDNDREKRKGKGRGWRKGLRKRTAGVARIYRLEYMSAGYRAEKGNLRSALVYEIGLDVRKMNRKSAIAAKKAQLAANRAARMRKRGENAAKRFRNAEMRARKQGGFI